MCGRYLLKALNQDIIRHFELVDGLDYFDEHGHRMKTEIFPGEEILAINKDHIAEDVWWTIRDRTWDGKFKNAINARAETITTVPMFRDAFREDRVLIPANAIYEWQEQPDKTRSRYEITFDEPLFALAGIARECEIKGEMRRCAAIVTTSPNDVFRHIHNAKQRQAVVIRREDHEKWLDPKTPLDELKKLMLPVTNEETHATRAEDEVDPCVQPSLSF